MYNALLPHAIGITGLDLAQSISLARDAGFQGVAFDIIEAREIADTKGVDHLRAMFDEAGIRPAVWSPPVDWMNDDVRADQIEKLGPYAELAAALGAKNVTTGIMPGSNDRSYDEQYEYLQERLRPYAEALDRYGIRIGIEFISPKTLRDQFSYQFIYTMTDMLAFAKDVGTGNVGLLFDMWHHYCSHGIAEDLEILKPEDVQLIHTNDAPEGIPIDEQQDLTRTLPMETEIIPAPAWLAKLAEIGVDCAVGAEPFSTRINELAEKDPLAAARETCEAQKKLFAEAGLKA